MKIKKLNDRQRRFIDEYMRDHNARAAARRSGYSSSTAALMKNPTVSAEIGRRMAREQAAAEVDSHYVLSSLKTIAERCMQEVPVLDHDGNPIGEYQFDSGGANRALELLGKHLELFTDRVKHDISTDAWKALDRFNAEARKAKEAKCK